MSIEKVKEYLKPFGAAERIREFPVSSATVELAAAALGVDPQRIAKTMSFRHGDGCMLIVAAGDARVDNSRFKAFFHEKARMLSPEEVLLKTGHPVGGVCPFALADSIPVYLDVSLRRFDTVFPACGSPNSAIELSCDELFRFSNAQAWVEVCSIRES